MSIRNAIRRGSAGRYRGAARLTLLLALLAAAPGGAQTPDLGRPVDAAEIALWNISIYPDGAGLPAGRGRAADGRTLYRQHCADCHGPGAIGLSAPALAGAAEPLDGEWPDQTVGSYWPYATTLFDFIRRAKPMNRPGRFSDAEVYALTAHLLALNGLLAADGELDAAALRRIEMPNRHGFHAVDADPGDVPRR